MTNDLADRLRACEAALQARSLTVAELLTELEKAQTAQKAWTEIGAKAEAAASDYRAALTGIGQALEEQLPDSHVLPLIREVLDRHVDAAPLLSAAHRLVAAWDRLCDCVEEFEDYNLEAMACGELKQYLDDAIVGLKGLLEGERAANAPEMPAAGLVTDGGDRERLGTEEQ